MGDKILELNEKKDVENLTIGEKKIFYEKLRKQCLLLKNDQACFGQDVIKFVYPFIRKYKIEIQGEENIPKDSNVIFVSNHSNSHDIFTAYEMLSLLKRRGSVMVASDCLNSVTVKFFDISNATLLDRKNKNERSKSVLTLSKKIMDGNDGIIFGEATWNLHPVLPMHNIKNGASKISLITQTPIVPVIFEYIEKEKEISFESQLFDKCIIRYGKPIMIDYINSLSYQSKNIKDEMASIRRDIWNDYGINRKSVEDIDPFMYVNHTYAKKFRALGYKHNSRLEQDYLLFLNNEPHENEYTINHNNEFVPGIIEEDSMQLRKKL